MIEKGQKIARWIRDHKDELIAMFIIVCILIQTAFLIKNVPAIEKSFKTFAFGEGRKTVDDKQVLSDIRVFPSVSISNSRSSTSPTWIQYIFR